MTVQVALTIEEREFVKQAADACTEANKYSNDIPDYDKSRFNLSGKQAGRLGKFAEAIVFKWLGGNVLNHSLDEWAHYVPNTHPDYDRLVKGNADLFNKVEVRRANNPRNPIPVRAKDRQPGVVVVQAHVGYMQPHPTKDNPFPGITVPMHGTILGWAYADDKGTKPEWAKQAGSLVVERRPLDTLNLKEVLGR